MFYHDEELDKVANKKADVGCRATMKSLADGYTNTGTARKILLAYEQAEKLGHLRTDIDITMVCLSQGILFFHKKLDEVRSSIHNMVPPVKGKVPTVVLTKMVAARIQEIVNLVKGRNSNMLESHRWTTANARNAGQPPPPPPVLLPIPDNFRTIQSIRDFLSTQPRNAWEMKQMENRMEREVLNKPELTDAIVASAMDLVICGLVAEE